MKSDSRIIIYNCRYKNQVWRCEIKDIKKSDKITAFSIRGRSSYYKIYLVDSGEERWIGIPEINKSSPLSSLEDTFWNSEKIGDIMNSIIDGITIAEGLKIINKKEE